MRLVEPSPPWGNGSICSSDLSIRGWCQKSKQIDLWKWDWHLLGIVQLLSFIFVLVVVLTLRCNFFFPFGNSLFAGIHENNWCNQFSFKCSDGVQMDKSIHIIWMSLLCPSFTMKKKALSLLSLPMWPCIFSLFMKKSLWNNDYILQMYPWNWCGVCQCRIAFSYIFSNQHQCIHGKRRFPL